MRGTAVQNQQCKDQQGMESDRISAGTTETQIVKTSWLLTQMEQEASEVRPDIMKVQLQVLMNKVLKLVTKDWVAQQ